MATLTNYVRYSDGILSGRLAIVTGGASGIGRAICCMFAREGAKVVLVDINQEGMEATKKLMVNAAQHLAVQADISDTESIARAMSQIQMTYKAAADICVNAAGVADDIPFLDTTPAQFDRLINTNLKGTFMMTQAACKAMIAAKVSAGTVVNFSSIVARTGNPGQSHYAATKGGIVPLTKTVAKELAQYNIRVNCVRPGLINTPMIQGVHPDMLEAVKPLIVLQRNGEPDEVAEVVTFLASSKSSYMTGAAVDIDAGLNF